MSGPLSALVRPRDESPQPSGPRFGTATKIVETHAQLFDGDRISVPTYVNEFWTAKQRQASSLHEVSYRACFKPQLPRFFIQRLTQPGDVVYDPFMGSGTTPVEAALHGRIPWGNDLNPLSLVFTTPRLLPPHLSLIQSHSATSAHSGRGCARSPGGTTRSCRRISWCFTTRTQPTTCAKTIHRRTAVR